MSAELIVEELCVKCGEALIVMGDKAYCTTCQPHVSFVVGYESAAHYSYVRVDPHRHVAGKRALARRSPSTPALRRRSSARLRSLPTGRIKR